MAEDQLVKHILILATILLMVRCHDFTEEAVCDQWYHPCSEDLRECCPDTTSQDFTWRIDTLGLDGSIATDMAILGHDNILVVGYFSVEVPDSDYDGSGLEIFDAARWDGTDWHYIRMSPTDPLYSILYFSEDDIWVCGTVPFHWDGHEWNTYNLSSMGVIDRGSTKYMWGRWDTDIYFIGDEGTFVRYDRQSFSSLATNTDIDLNSISGNYEEQIVATGRTLNSIILSLTYELSVVYETSIYNDINFGQVKCVDFDGRQFLIGCGSGVIEYDISSGDLNLLTNDSIGVDINGPVYFIKSQSPNDVVLVSKRGEVISYNGVSWKRHNEINELVLSNELFKPIGLGYKDDVVVIVGEIKNNGKAVVIIGE